MSATNLSERAPRSQLRDAISEHYCVDEIPCAHALTSQFSLETHELEAISAQAISVCQSAINNSLDDTSLQALLKEFELSSDEGIALMGLSEALLRIPDKEVATQLIADRLAAGRWEEHVDADKSPRLNASSIMLLLTGKLLSPSHHKAKESYAHKLLRKLSQPMIHRAVKQVVERIAGQFVFAETIEQAMGQVNMNQQILDGYSVDMLGEQALCEKDADAYFEAYKTALNQIAEEGLRARVGVSVKLSALYPRYEYKQVPECIDRLVVTMTPLLKLANQHGIAMTIDAEEADRLELGLDVFTRLFEQTSHSDLCSFGLAVQAYSPRALPLLHYLKHLSEAQGRIIPVRLVKGAYWDSEIKQAQAKGLAFYPVFTSKQHTDLSYLACAEFLLANRHCFYPQFATHNALTICHILSRAEPDDSYEFQRLHGMGEDIYQSVRENHPELKVRVYAPVGEHQVLLPYLVRRILENGANSSFLKQVLDDPEEIAQACQHPLMGGLTYDLPLPLPKDIYQPERENSDGINLADAFERAAFLEQIKRYDAVRWDEDKIISLPGEQSEPLEIVSPYDGQAVGLCYQMSRTAGIKALERAHKAQNSWQEKSVDCRVQVLERFALLLEQHRVECIALLIRESGKTIEDAVNEVREAIDFARYYADQMQGMAKQPSQLRHIAGEQNRFYLEGRGVFLCISPWNFPLAIFCGQVCAALVAGNAVLAKPALATPLIAHLAVKLLYQAGCPKSVLQLLTGKGRELCAELLLDDRLSGIAFTGSTTSAKQIHHTLAEREGAMVPLIAETGGQNVMIVHSSALADQVVQDVMHSAFFSAGQRCSSLRVLYVQDSIADRVLDLLQGAIQTLCLGDPADLKTDIGPLISAQAKRRLEVHCHCLEVQGRLLFKGALPGACKANLLAPHVFEIESINDLGEEHFGPILHVIRYAYRKIDQVVSEVNAYGFGLTCGIQSRNERWAKQLARRLKVGNVYINRDMTGAIVGTQPFGGQGLSGTGFKSGGPHYLLRFLAEKTITTNLSAIGGDLDLLAPRRE